MESYVLIKVASGPTDLVFYRCWEYKQVDTWLHTSFPKVFEYLDTYGDIEKPLWWLLKATCKTVVAFRSRPTGIHLVECKETGNHNWTETDLYIGL